MKWPLIVSVVLSLSLSLTVAQEISLDSLSSEQLHELEWEELNSLFEQAFYKGDLLTAKEIAEISIEVAKEQFGPRHQSVGESLTNLGYIYRLAGIFPKAVALFQEGVDIIIESVGKDSKDYGSAINNFALLYMDMGDNERALDMMMEAKENTERILGKEHAHYANRLNNLAHIYKNLGYPEKAVSLTLEALDITEKTEGVDHPHYGDRLNNLGFLSKKMGDWEASAAYYKRAIDNTKKAYGEEHFMYSIRLTNLASLYQDLDRYEEALPLQVQALEITEKSFGKQHFRYASQLNNLGICYLWMRNFEKARPILEEALELTKEIFGEEHFLYSTRLNNIGLLHLGSSNHEEAQQLFERSHEISLQSFGPGTEAIRTSLLNLSTTYDARKLRQKSADTYMDLLASNRMEIKQRFFLLNDRMKVSFLRSLAYAYNRAYSFSLRNPSYESLIQQAYSDQLFIKGLLQSNQRSLLQTLRQHKDTSIAQAFAQWEDLHKLLAVQYTKPAKQRIRNFEEIVDQANQLEIKLADISKEFRQARKVVSWQEVQQGLQEGEAAVEFHRFRYYYYDWPSDSFMYVAYVLKHEGPPQMVYLFEENELNPLISETPQLSSTEQLYAFRGNRGINPKKQNQPSYLNLTELVWSPIDSLLSGIKKVYFAPDGLLNRINLHAIPLNEQVYLTDKYQLIQLESTRNLIQNQPVSVNSEEKASKHALLFGGIQYGSIASQEAPWTYLQGTYKEVEQLESLLRQHNYQVRLETGDSAKESRLKTLDKAPDILHIATHGYFFPDLVDTSHQGIFNKKSIPPIQLSDHPMVRSGLILSNANQAWTGHSIPEGQEDGILTAYEISRMDLSNTELVVLSACETGLGDVQGNEGVYGLQRAFKIAGAKYILMSLWQVPDQATQELMTAFYEKWLGGMEIRAALQAAQKQMRKKYKEPYYWAGFVLVE